MPTKKLEDNYIPFQCMIMNNIKQFDIEGVSTAQYYILDILNNQGAKTTNELSKIRKITQSGISKLTKRLLDKNYIKQERQESDRRSYSIFITSEGKKFLLRAEKFRNEIMNLIEKTLTEEELNTFIKLCKKITDSYHKE
ncbi:MarR family winged helix-turn-helix transcriptional regulator [Clostridium arbusti]|uniref:MarR family winged helix-turn-helix transcriptional regulator n=1 Tax=Clostridium arbusti TaxID=1137848 RepID=UPI000288C8BE|nr:MarR family transcriptional regulator [Clostridium arbusti]